jgi:hypothetical protein
VTSFRLFSTSVLKQNWINRTVSDINYAPQTE